MNWDVTVLAILMVSWFWGMWLTRRKGKNENYIRSTDLSVRLWRVVFSQRRLRSLSGVRDVER